MSEKVQIHVRVSKRTRQRLKLMADEDGTSMIELAEALIEQALANEEVSRVPDKSALALGDRMRLMSWKSVRTTSA